MHESICFILYNFEKNTCGHSRLKLCKEKVYLNSQINCLKSLLKIASSSHIKNVRTNSEAKGKLINTEGIQESETLLDKMNFNIPANPEEVQFQKKILWP